LSSWRLSSNYW